MKKLFFPLAALALSISLASCSKSNEALIKEYKELGEQIEAAAEKGDMQKIATLAQKGQKLAKELDGREFTEDEQVEILEITSEIAKAAASASGLKF